MPKHLSVLKWTAKTPLSSRIQDPLGLYTLKFLERYFLPGITTQTERLRYYSFLTWAWKAIAERNLRRSKILDMEKAVTLAAALHHLDDSDPPRGIRNRQSAKAFLQTHRSIKTKRFANFGRNNRMGYGNYYYRGPLATLRICATLGNDIVVSEMGERIAKSFSRTIQDKTNLVLKSQLSRRDLSKLSSLCFCTGKIPPAEQRLWRMVFFGFTKPSEGFGLSPDDEEFATFRQARMTFHDIAINSSLNIEDYLKGTERADIILSDSLQETVKTTLARRYTLFQIMKIIGEAQPLANALNQTIRDCMYFNQFDDGKRLRTLTLDH